MSNGKKNKHITKLIMFLASTPKDMASLIGGSLATIAIVTAVISVAMVETITYPIFSLFDDDDYPPKGGSCSQPLVMATLKY